MDLARPMSVVTPTLDGAVLSALQPNAVGAVGPRTRPRDLCATREGFEVIRESGAPVDAGEDETVAVAVDTAVLCGSQL